MNEAAPVGKDEGGQDASPDASTPRQGRTREAMSPESNHWFVDHANIVTLVHYLADRGDSAREVAYAVEKPWKYEEEFRTAQAILDETTAVPA